LYISICDRMVCRLNFTELSFASLVEEENCGMNRGGQHRHDDHHNQDFDQCEGIPTVF